MPECLECGSEFSSSSYHDPFWGLEFEDENCPACSGEGRCDTEGCGNKAETRKDVDGVLRRYAVFCDPCRKEAADDDDMEPEEQ